VRDLITLRSLGSIANKLNRHGKGRSVVVDYLPSNIINQYNSLKYNRQTLHEKESRFRALKEESNLKA